MRPIGDHFYTASAQERDSAIVAFGYISEGIEAWVPPAAAGTTPLFRTVDPASGDHFYTTSAVERDNAVQNLGHVDEGIACYVFAVAAAGTTPLFRLANPANGDHFYTISTVERDNAVQNLGHIDEGIACHVFSADGLGRMPLHRLLKSFGARMRLHLKVVQDHRDEGVACYVYAASQPSTTPLFRLANSANGDHFYTASAIERDNAIQNLGHIDEGIACYVFGAAAADTTPLFRLANPANGDHFYTISTIERDNAVQNLGHIDEGIACHVFAARAAGTTSLFRTVSLTTGDHFYTTSAIERASAVGNPLALLTIPPGTVAINRMVQSMQQTYAGVNILVEVASTEILGLPDLLDIQAQSPQEGQLFANRNYVGINDIVAYFVRTARTADGIVNGFAYPGQPAVVSSISSPWTLAHEVGHCLDLDHIAGEHTNCPPTGPANCCNTPNFNRLMTGCGTWGIINPPPDLDGNEVAMMDGRAETEDI